MLSGEPWTSWWPCCAPRATPPGCACCCCCAQAELTVSELIEIVGQCQPRVSRHLKLLGEAGLLERFKEGSWVFYRAADRGKGAELGAGAGGAWPIPA